MINRYCNNSGKNRNTIMFFSSLYNPLVDIIKNKKWQPKGLPAYCKLIEGLSKQNIPLVIICHCRKALAGFSWIKNVRVEGINATVYVLPWVNVGLFPKRLESLLNRIFHFSCILFFALKHNPGLIYTDKSHTRQAAFFTLLGKKVFLRIYGVTKELLDFMESNRNKTIKNITYYSFFARYTYVLGTLDGSDIDVFFSTYINPNVPKQVLLNGIDKKQSTTGKYIDIRKRFNIKGNEKIIVFLSQFSHQKGGQEYINVIAELSKLTNNFTALMVGYGPLEEHYRNLISQTSLDREIRIINGIKHAEVNGLLSQADIFLSFNMEGNICNTVLEAFGAGVPVLTFKDRHTQQFFGEVVFYVNKNDTFEMIGNVVHKTISDEMNLMRHKKLTKTFVDKKISSWDQRIADEIGIINGILQ